MPTTSSQGTFPVPEPSDPPDVPYWIGSFADDVDEKALMHTDGVRRRVHLQFYNGGNTDASGFLTITHTAPFTPRAAIQFPRAIGTSWAIAWGVDQFSASGARTRWKAGNATGALVSQATGNFAVLYIE